MRSSLPTNQLSTAIRTGKELLPYRSLQPEAGISSFAAVVEIETGLFDQWLGVSLGLGE
jgi:hypothetical protein